MREKSKGSWLVAKKLLVFLKPYILWIVLCVFSVLVIAGTDLVLANLTKTLVDNAVASKYSEAVECVKLVFAAAIAGFLFKYLVKYSAGYFSISAMRDLREKLYNHIREAQMSYMEANHTGEIVSRMTSSASTIQVFLENDLHNLIYQPLVFAGSLAYLIFISWKLLLANILIVAVAMIVVIVASIPVEKYVKEVQEYLGKLNAIAQETIGGIHIVKAFNLENVLLQKYRRVLGSALTGGLKMEKRISPAVPANEMIMVLPIMVSTAYGGYLAVKGQISPGDLIIFLLLLDYLSGAAATFPRLITDFNTMVGCASHVFEIMDIPVEVKTGIDVESEAGAVPVKFDNVVFSYDGRSNVLDGLSFILEKNKKIALVGQSGCGKSTVVKLLCGFYKARDGKIEVYGNDASCCNLSSLRSQIAVVSQDVYLYPVTVWENISYGRPEASMGEIVAAARNANAHEFIMKLPEGYNTLLGERGARLSGGQRQRISIARAFLKDSGIVLLDEPTSALDTQSEASVQEAIDRLTASKSVIVIAHRLSTIKNADEILVLDKGKIAEKGTHEELVGMDGVYGRLCKGQLSDQEPAALREEECIC